MIKFFQSDDLDVLECEFNKFEKTSNIVTKSRQQTQSYDSRESKTIITLSVFYERKEDV